MEHSLQYFAEETKELLGDALTRVQSTHPKTIFYTEQLVDDVLDALEQMRIEHGVSIGYICNEEGSLLGLGGFYYLDDVALYEVVCYMLPEYADEAEEVFQYLVQHAFVQLSMDKVCARTLAGFGEDGMFRDMGFVYLGERAFTEEGAEQIWHYYELENEANMVSSTSYSGQLYSDWDSVF